LHDTVWFEIHGTPAVSIVSTEFVSAAAVQADALGMTDAQRVFVQHPIQDATDQEMRDKADAIVEATLATLTAAKGAGDEALE
jgi:hypothetical protein|tara:strand:- start:22339 stop:22587 length:249 start_codon:yes stop_codon:yes gene_type:complete